MAGEGPSPDLVVLQVTRLPVGSGYISAKLAEQRGGSAEDYLGKDHAWYLAADTYDAIMLNTKVSGNWKKGKAPKFDPYPRPGSKQASGKPSTAPDMLNSIFTKMGGAGKKG